MFSQSKESVIIHFHFHHALLNTVVEIQLVLNTTLLLVLFIIERGVYSN